MKAVAKCANLRVLSMPNCFEVCDDGIVAIASACPSMERMSLFGCKNVSDRSIKSLSSSCTILEDLGLRGCEAVSCGKGSALWDLASTTKTLVNLEWPDGRTSTWEQWFGGRERVLISGPGGGDTADSRIKEYEAYLDQNPPPGWAEARAGPAGLQEIMETTGGLSFTLCLGGRQKPQMRPDNYDDEEIELSITAQITKVAFIGTSITFFDGLHGQGGAKPEEYARLLQPLRDVGDNRSPRGA